LVLILVLGLTATACGIPTAGRPTAISKKDVPFNLLSPANPTTSSSTVPQAVAVPELIFLVAPTQTLAPVARGVPASTTLSGTLTQVLEALLEGPKANESASGLQTFLTGTETKVSAKVTGGIATIDFGTNPIQVVGANQTLAIAQVVYTATALNGVTGVVFQIGNQPIEVPTASGATVPGPVDRTSYLPQAPVF
jgi:spore germination protein GerM